MKKFKLFWLGGKVQEVEGADIASAMNNAGIGQGALKALDYWKEIVVDISDKEETE